MLKNLLSVDEFISKYKNEETPFKVILCKDYLEAYYRVKGEYPPPYLLNKITDWLLADELSDVSRSKVQRKEYPVLSKPQLERRNREISMDIEIVDMLKLKKQSNMPTNQKHKKNEDN